MDYNEKKKWTDHLVSFLEEPNENDMNSWIKVFTEFKKKLLEDQHFFDTGSGKNELSENPELKPYCDFVSDLKFRRDRITLKSYFENLGAVQASYRTYLKGRG